MEGGQEFWAGQYTQGELQGWLVSLAAPIRASVRLSAPGSLLAQIPDELMEAQFSWKHIVLGF